MSTDEAAGSANKYSLSFEVHVSLTRFSIGAIVEAVRSCTTYRLLGVHKFHDRFFVLCAQRGANPHVANNGSRNLWREALRRLMAAGAILLEHPFTVRFF